MERGPGSKADSVDKYIGSFPRSIQAKLRQLREAIKEAAPEAVESISYGMPAYKLNGRPLVYFAAFERHIGFYPTPSGVEEFKADLARYKQGKGSVQFPLNETMPVELVKRIVIFRAESNKAKATGKEKKE